jgi:large subunit ribosomal protein L25
MPSARPSLVATDRQVTGKAVARLRREGRLPAVVYGHGVASTNVSVDSHEFELLRRKAGPNTLIDLTVDGKRPNPVLVHDIQVHPVSRKPLHIDLFLVRMTEELTVDVPLVPIGVSPAIEEANGTLIHATESVRVRALPDHLPQSIQYSIESLVDFETAIHVRDLDIPSDVTLLNDPDDLVARVMQPRVEAEPEPVAVEGEEGAEAPEGAESAEGGAEGGAAEGGTEESSEG